jgi:uncharacterized membrane protein YhaH (DUF805 family)
MAKAWHYAWAGKSEGPVDEVTMGDLIRAGRVRADTLVWAEGMASWEPAGKHFGFAPAQPAMPFTPPPMPHYAASAGQPTPAAPARSFTEAIKVCFQNYATFRGRASRSEFWWFQLFTSLLGMLGAVLEQGMGSDGQALSGIFALATFLPSLSVQVRRLHDVNRSGWWIGGFLLAIIPVAVVFGVLAGMSETPGADNPVMSLFAIVMLLAVTAYGIAMFVFLVSRGTPGPNRFG